jgi:hypothetical protein
MRRTFLRGVMSLAVASATAGVVAAQTPSSSASSPHPGRATGNAAPVVYSGCLKAGADLATGSTLTPGASSSTPLSGYVLTSVQLNPNASPTSNTPPLAATAPPGQSPTTTTPPATPPTTPPPTTGTATAGSATNAGAMYRIVGLQDQELQKFANQRVEIRGVMESTDTTATTGTTGAPTSSQPASTTTNPATGTSGTTAAVGTSSGSNPTAAGAVPTFRATSIRVLSENCSGGTSN